MTHLLSMVLNNVDENSFQVTPRSSRNTNDYVRTVSAISINESADKYSNSQFANTTFIAKTPLAKAGNQWIECSEGDVSFQKLIEKHLYNLILGWVIGSFQQLSGVNAYYQYAYYFGFNSTNRFIMRLIVATLNIIFTACALWMIQNRGRKILLMDGYLIACFWNCIIFQVYDKEMHDDGEDPYIVTIKVLGIAIIIVFIISYSLYIGSTTWVYMAETLPPRAMGIAVWVHWIVNFIIYYTPWMLIEAKHFDDIEHNHFDEYVSIFFFIFSGCWVAGFFIVLVFLQETKELGEDIKKTIYTDSYDPMVGRKNKSWMSSIDQ